MKNKTLLFSITIKDFETSTFTVKDPGGSGKDTSQTGIRLTHLGFRTVQPKLT